MAPRHTPEWIGNFGLDIGDSLEMVIGRRAEDEDEDEKDEVDEEEGAEIGGIKAPDNEGRKLEREGGAICFAEDDIVNR